MEIDKWIEAFEQKLREKSDLKERYLPVKDLFDLLSSLLKAIKKDIENKS